MINEPTVKRWTAMRKAAVIMDIFIGKTSVAEETRPKYIREECESELRETKETLGETHLQFNALGSIRKFSCLCKPGIPWVASSGTVGHSA